jgi:fibronectin type 3 domain-containing protein
VAPGSTSASASVTGGNDCLVWVGQALSVAAPLTAPTVTATGGAHMVGLSWDRVPYAKSYAVYESTTPTGETYTAPPACKATAPRCDITGLAAAKKYYFTVVAKAGTASSPPSAQVTATTT